MAIFTTSLRLEVTRVYAALGSLCSCTLMARSISSSRVSDPEVLDLQKIDLKGIIRDERLFFGLKRRHELHLALQLTTFVIPVQRLFFPVPFLLSFSYLRLPAKTRTWRIKGCSCHLLVTIRRYLFLPALKRIKPFCMSPALTTSSKVSILRLF